LLVIVCKKEISPDEGPRSFTDIGLKRITQKKGPDNLITGDPGMLLCKVKELLTKALS
jgi:hypothetical protein